ncbi:hypothetical protein BDR06DRAFT_977477 [Suillus hirtellus]|nr:hypothetical protein BDR06DRAFT_977477 [Suillus hirtellus]
MADHNTINLKLPVWVKLFKFTFEYSKPGPMAIDISMQEPLDWELPSGTACCTDASKPPAMKPGAAQVLVGSTTRQLLDNPAKIMPVPNDSETEPELEPKAQTLKEFTKWYEANKAMHVFVLYYDY